MYKTLLSTAVDAGHTGSLGSFGSPDLRDRESAGTACAIWGFAGTTAAVRRREWQIRGQGY
jgi:hypothetical protein